MEHSNISKPMVCLPIYIHDSSLIRTSSIYSELDYYDMAATKGTPFFPDNARLFFYLPHLRPILLHYLLFRINFSL